MSSENDESQDGGISSTKIILYIIAFIIFIIGLYIIMQIFNNSPFNKGLQEVLGWGAAAVGLVTDNCTKTTECSKLKDSENCKNQSAQCAYDDDKNKCINFTGYKEGTGGPASFRCLFGLTAFAELIGSAALLLAICKGFGFNKTTNELAKGENKTNLEYSKDVANRAAPDTARVIEEKPAASELEMKEISKTSTLKVLLEDAIKQKNAAHTELTEKSKLAYDTAVELKESLENDRERRAEDIKDFNDKVEDINKDLPDGAKPIDPIKIKVE